MKFFAVWKAEDWPEYRVIPITEFQARKFLGDKKLKGYVVTNRRQAHAIKRRLNKERENDNDDAGTARSE